MSDTTKIGIYALGGLVGGLLLAKGIRMLGGLIRLGVQTVGPLIVTEILRKPAGSRRATGGDGQTVVARDADASGGDFGGVEFEQFQAASPAPAPPVALEEPPADLGPEPEFEEQPEAEFESDPSEAEFEEESVEERAEEVRDSNFVPFSVLGCIPSPQPNIVSGTFDTEESVGAEDLEDVEETGSEELPDDGADSSDMVWARDESSDEQETDSTFETEAEQDPYAEVAEDVVVSSLAEVGESAESEFDEDVESRESDEEIKAEFVAEFKDALEAGCEDIDAMFERSDADESNDDDSERSDELDEEEQSDHGEVWAEESVAADDEDSAEDVSEEPESVEEEAGAPEFGIYDPEESDNFVEEIQPPAQAVVPFGGLLDDADKVGSADLEAVLDAFSFPEPKGGITEADEPVGAESWDEAAAVVDSDNDPSTDVEPVVNPFQPRPVAFQSNDEPTGESPLATLNEGGDPAAENAENPDSDQPVDPIQIFRRGAAALAEDAEANAADADAADIEMQEDSQQFPFGTLPKAVIPPPVMESPAASVAVESAAVLEEGGDDDAVMLSSGDEIASDAPHYGLLKRGVVRPVPAESNTGDEPVFKPIAFSSRVAEKPVTNPFASRSEFDQQIENELVAGEQLSGFRQAAVELPEAPEPDITPPEDGDQRGGFSKFMLGAGAIAAVGGLAFWGWTAMMKPSDDPVPSKVGVAAKAPAAASKPDSTSEVDLSPPAEPASSPQPPEIVGAAPVDIPPAPVPAETGAEVLANTQPAEVAMPIAGDADAAVKGFLDAGNWRERIAYVHREDVTDEEFEAFYNTHGDRPFSYAGFVETAAGKVPDSDLDTFLYTLRTADLPDGFVVSVEQTANGYLIDWHGFVQFAYGLFAQFAEDPEAEEARFYAAAKRSHFFGSGVPGVESKLCVRVISPVDNSREIYAFADEDSIAADQIKESFRWGSTYRPVLHLEWTGKPGARYVRLKAIERLTWRSRD